VPPSPRAHPLPCLTNMAPCARAVPSLPHPPAEPTTEASLRDYAKVLSRQVAALEVAQPLLARKYNLLKAQLGAARQAARTAELSAVEMEAHLRHRILYLEVWKKGAEARLSRLTSMAQTWVPGADFDRVLTELQQLQRRYTGERGGGGGERGGGQE